MSWEDESYPKNPDPPDVSLPRTLKPPKLGYFMTGSDVIAMKRGISRAGRYHWAPWDDGYADSFAFGTDEKTVNQTGVKGFQRQMKIDMTGILGVHTFEAMRISLIPKGLAHAGEPLFDAVALEILRSYSQGGSNVPDLGPMTPGGKSVLDQDLTHETSGLDNYPAFDDVFQAGAPVVAPEDLTVTSQSSANPGDAFYATGKSGLKYWIAHLTSSPSNGETFKKGEKLSTVLQTDVSGGSHVHVGMDGRPVMGYQFVYNTSYQHGAPTVGVQLEGALG
jgi:hypothetical protein